MTKQLIGTGQLSLTKIAKGLPGESAKYVTVSGEQIFRYSDTEMLSVPTPNTITLTANVFNVNSRDIKWYYKRSNSSNWTPLINSKTGRQLTGVDELQVDPNESYWSSSTSVTFSCVVDGEYYDQVTVIKLAEGDAYSALLTNETQNIATDINGDFSQEDLEEIVTSVQVFRGTRRLSLAFDNTDPAVGEYTLELINKKNLDAEIDYNTGIIKMTHLSSSSSSGSLDVDITIKASDGVSGNKKIVKTFTLTKSKQGEAGEDGHDAKQVVVSGASVFTIGSDINKTITPSEIVFTGVYRNIENPTINKWERYTENEEWVTIAHTPKVSEIAFSDSNYSTLTIFPNAYELATRGNLLLRYNVDEHTDESSVTQISESSGYIASLTNSTHTIAAYHNGDLHEGEAEEAFTNIEAYKNTSVLTGVQTKSQLSEGKFYAEVVSVNPVKSDNIVQKLDEDTFGLLSINKDTKTLKANIRIYFESTTDFQDKIFTITKSLAGEPGEPGKGVNAIVEHYLATNSSSGVTTSTPGWTTSVQSVSQTKKYLWNYEEVFYTTGEVIGTDPIIIGTYGDSGVGISDIVNYYLVSGANSGVTHSTSGWERDPQPTTPSHRYLWNYEQVLYTDGSEVNTPPAIIGTHGENGEDGITYYTWIKYADTPTSGMSDSSVGKMYVGLAYNKTTEEESVLYSDYQWSKIVGDQGIPGAPGADGKTYYTWVKYADTPTTGMSDDPTGKAYLGLAHNKEVQQESTVYSDYKWSKIQGAVGPTGPQGPPGNDGDLSDFPDTLPATPELKYQTFGFGSIELSWTFQNELYYSYELHASQTNNFSPSVTNRIFKGHASSFLHSVEPGDNWYYRVCAINTHGRRTSYSPQVRAASPKIEDLSNYIQDAAIGQALIGNLSADVIKSGKFTGHFIDAKNLTVTDGNGKKTLEIDSFGRVNLDVTSLKIQSSSVATKTDVSTAQSNATNAANSATDNKLKSYSTTTQMNSAIKSSADNITIEVGKTVTESIDNIQIGGTNIMTGDNSSSVYRSYRTGQHYTSLGNSPTSMFIEGDTVTFRLYLKPDSSGKGAAARITWNVTGGSAGAYVSSIGNYIAAGKEGYSEVTTTLKKIDKTSGRLVQFCVQNQDTSNSAYTSTGQFKEAKAEFGTKATTWSPAPADVSTSIGNAVTSANKATDTKLLNYSTTTQMNSAIKSSADNITIGVSKTYETQANVTSKANAAQANAIAAASTDATNKANSALASANSATDTKLKSYSTTTQMNTAITTSANNINMSVSSTYETKTNVTSKANAAQANAISSANASTDAKLKNYSTTTQMNTAIALKETNILSTVSSSYYTKTQVDSKKYQTESQVNQTVNNLQIKFTQSGGYNRVLNGTFGNGMTKWSNWGSCTRTVVTSSSSGHPKALRLDTTGMNQGVAQYIGGLVSGRTYVLSAMVSSGSTGAAGIQVSTGGQYYSARTTQASYQRIAVTFKAAADNATVQIGRGGWGSNGTHYFTAIQLEEGALNTEYTPHPSEIYDGITTIDRDGITIDCSGANTTAQMSASGFTVRRKSDNKALITTSGGNLTMEGTLKTGVSGKVIEMKDSDYRIYDGANLKGFFGFRSLDNDASVCKMALAHIGLNRLTNNYFVATAYPKDENPEKNPKSYADLAYVTQDHKTNGKGDVSNVKFYADGDIKIAPIKSLEITSNYMNGSHAGSTENFVARFATSTSSDFNGFLEIGSIVNKLNSRGLILQEIKSGGTATVHLLVDSSGNRMFKPTINNHVWMGSPSFNWSRLYAVSIMSSQGVSINPATTISNELITNDKVLDGINFISTLDSSDELKMDVTNIQNTKYVEVSEENGNVMIDNSEMIKLLIMEVQKLKNEVNTLKKTN